MNSLQQVMGAIGTAVAINGSPRKGWNTEKLLKEALRGAESAGAETKLVQLYDLRLPCEY